MSKKVLGLEDTPHCARHAAPGVLAESAHAFAKLTASTNGTTARYVPTEATATTSCGFSGAAERSAYAVPALVWTVAAHAPTAFALRHVEHTRAFVLSLHNISTRC